MNDVNFTATLKLAADSPERLRRCDVDRVMCDARNRGYLDGFRAWLLPLVSPEVRAEVASWVWEE